MDSDGNSGHSRIKKGPPGNVGALLGELSSKLTTDRPPLAPTGEQPDVRAAQRQMNLCTDGHQGDVTLQDVSGPQLAIRRVGG